MAYSYSNHGPPAHSHHLEPPSLTSRILARVPSGVYGQIQRIWERYSHHSISTSGSRTPRPLRNIERDWHPRRLLCLPNLFIALWVVLLLWGERWVFQSSIGECEWDRWERWPSEATPHHLVFLADPQLIDPHSYPGRPWPLDKFTMLHTDNYMKRSYINLQDKLHPDTIFFLGDLFDGGREWKRAKGNTVDPSWKDGQRPSGEAAFAETWGKRYGEDFWLHEYDRFGRIFYKFWNLAEANPGPWQRGRKIISTLPGNHDLGFGEQIKLGIRNRFEVYFGEGNRVDVIGNHTFVSVDSVSLSAGGSAHDVTDITKPVEDFLSNVQISKRKAVARELSLLAGNEKVLQYNHRAEDLATADFKNLPTLDPGPSGADFPTILLTHVPLYRDPGTPCGPKREHWPPTPPEKGQPPVMPDHRNAISISAGYQYQNVLSNEHSVKLISSIGNVVSIFSGDDHDYCEIVHPANKNNAREITVKSMSWAMGVRKPGFLLLSMWNPVNALGQPVHSSPTGHGSSNQGLITTESHLCLLPDQLGIFIRYLILLVFTLLTLSIRAILVPILKLAPFSIPHCSTTTDLNPSPLLPTSYKQDKSDPDTLSNSSTCSTSSNNTLPAQLAPRSSAARTRSVSPANGYGLPPSQLRSATPPLLPHMQNHTPATYYSSSRDKELEGNGRGWYEDAGKRKENVLNSWGDEREHARVQKRKPDTPLGVVLREARTSIWRVAWVVLMWYMYLVWFG